MRWRYFEGLTLRQIVGRLGISSERARQIIVEMLARARAADNDAAFTTEDAERKGNDAHA